MPNLPKPYSRPDDRLANALTGLTAAMAALAGQTQAQTEWLKSHFALATLQDLKKMENRIMAEVTVVKAQLQEAIASAKQTNLDIAEVQKTITANTAKIAELEAAVAAGGVSQEIADLVTEVRDLNKAADDGLPNPVVVPGDPNPNPEPEPQSRRR